LLLALTVFFLGETLKRRAQGKYLRKALAHALEFEGYYRKKLPRPFLYYAFYPLLFPYWLINREARQEFLMFRSYTVGAFLVLAGNLIVQFFWRWQPELGWRDFAPVVFVTLAVETLLVLWLLMPLATSVVWYHASFRRKRLGAVLLVALASTSVTVWRVTNRRDPIVSYSARKRIPLRTAAYKERAHTALLVAVRDALSNLRKQGQWPKNAFIQGEALDAAHRALARFYKSDEVSAFELHFKAEGSRQVLVLQTKAHGRQQPTWIAVDSEDHEITDLANLPESLAAGLKASSGGEGSSD
jgi:hypothetical protein